MNPVLKTKLSIVLDKLLKCFGLFVRKAIIVILVAHATIRHAADLRGIIFKIILEIRHFFGLLLYWKNKKSARRTRAGGRGRRRGACVWEFLAGRRCLCLWEQAGGLCLCGGGWEGCITGAGALGGVEGHFSGDRGDAGGFGRVREPLGLVCSAGACAGSAWGPCEAPGGVQTRFSLLSL